MRSGPLLTPQAEKERSRRAQYGEEGARGDMDRTEGIHTCIHACIHTHACTHKQTYTHTYILMARNAVWSFADATS